MIFPLSVNLKPLLKIRKPFALCYCVISNKNSINADLVLGHILNVTNPVVLLHPCKIRFRIFVNKISNYDVRKCIYAQPD